VVQNIISSRPTWAKLASPYLKNKIQTKRARDMAQIIQHMPDMHEVLGSITSITKKKKKKSISNQRAPGTTPEKEKELYPVVCN
jgi:hypothetical protein